MLTIAKFGQVREVLMEKISWQARIVVDSDLHHGDPCIKGTRIPVSMILGSLADGLTPAEIQAAYDAAMQKSI